MTKKEYQRQWRLENKNKMRFYHREYSKKWRKENKDRLRFYWVWHMMRRRCEDKNLKQYQDYGGRGITYCERWKEFEKFKEDMFSDYKPELTLDRIDVNGMYCKENCKWSTHKEQNENKRCNITIKYEGQEKTLLQWRKDLKMDISYDTLRSRYYRGMPSYKILKIELYRSAKL